MIKLRFYAKHGFIILWVLWVMLCVRFGFRIGLIGSEGEAGNVSTILFVAVFSALIPLSLLFIKKNSVPRLIYAGIPFSAAGIAVFFVLPSFIFLSSTLLAAGSAFFTAAFLYLYVFDLTKQKQISLIIAFLIVKPLFSLSALFLSVNTEKTAYILTAAGVLAGIAICARRLAQNKPSFHKPLEKTVAKAPFRTLFGIYILFSLIVFERMNGAFSLFSSGISSPGLYYFYFAGGLAGAMAAWWMFVRKKMPLTLSYDIFLFAALIHFVLTIASANGLILFGGLNLVFFGISDIIYVFLFATAASISAVYGKKVFMGFVFVFGAALLCGFSLSNFLYTSFPGVTVTIYALSSLIMLAISFLLAPQLRNLSRRIAAQKGARNPSENNFEIEFNRDSGPAASPLTIRENEIVAFYLKGYSNQQIAQLLHIAPSTVKVHSRNIYEKLKIKSRLELFFLFQEKTKQSEKQGL